MRNVRIVSFTKTSNDFYVLYLAGDMDHATVNSLTYKPHEGARPAERVDPRPRGHPTAPAPGPAAGRRDRLSGETQFSRDFAPKGPLPLPPRPVTPPPATIDLKFDNQ